MEEEYRRQRGRVRWALQGDANTAYFHAVANGRRRRCLISSLQTEVGPISDPRLIQEHIYDFYRELLGSESPRQLGLSPQTWLASKRVSAADNEALALTFSETVLEAIFQYMKSNTAPGPDGFPVSFFKKFWPECQLGGLAHPGRFHPG